MLRVPASAVPFAAALLTAFALLAADSIAQEDGEAAAACAWTMLRHDLTNSGRADAGSDALQGEVAWSYLASTRVTTSPIVADGVLYVCDGNTVVHAVDIEKRELIWSSQPRRSKRQRTGERPTIAPEDLIGSPAAAKGTQTASYASPVVSGERIFAVTEQGIVFALDRKTGKELWEREMDGNVFTSLRVVKGKVLFGCLDFHFHALDEATGDTVWSYEAGDIIGSTPAITASGKIYVAAFDRRVHVLDLDTGKLVRAFEIGCRTTAPLVYAEATLFFPNDQRQVAAVDVLDGKLRWHQPSSRFHQQGAAYDDGRIYVHIERYLCCFRASDGQVIWRAELDATGAVSPCVGDRLVYHSDGNGTVYAFDKRDGAPRWKVRFEGHSWAPPSLVDGTLWVCDGVGRVMAIR